MTLKRRTLLVVAVFGALIALMSSQSALAQLTATIVEEASETSVSAVRDSLVAIVTWVLDDNLAGAWDAVTALDASTNTQVGGMSVIGWQALHGDTSVHLPRHKIDKMRARGWTLGNHMYMNTFTASGDYSPTGTSWLVDLYKGKFSNVTVHNAINDGFLAVRDTLGQGSCDWGTWPGLVSNSYMRETASGIGHSFFFGAGWVTGSNQRGEIIEARIHPGFPSNVTTPHMPGMLMNPYNIPRAAFIESQSFEEFRKILAHAARKKTWLVITFHDPADVTTFSGHAFSDYVALVDSFITEGEVVVMTPEDAFDSFYRSEISGQANYIWENFDAIDANGDVPDASDQPAFMSQYANVTFHRDSLYNAATKKSVGGTHYHGFGEGVGYATLDWDNPGTGPAMFSSTWGQYTSSAVLANHSNSWSYRNCEWVVNRKPGSDWIEFEIYATVDTAVAAPADGDSIAVVFYATYNVQIENLNQGVREHMDGQSKFWGTNQWDEKWVSIETSGWTVANSRSAFLGNFSRFQYNVTDSTIVGNRWVQLQARWHPPEDADYVYINLCKDGNLPSGAVMISRPSVRWVQRGKF